jgi:hypothetical protein
MATNEVFMDVPEVQKIVKSFTQFADAIKTIANILQVTSDALKATAFISFGATAAVAAFIDGILPAVKAASSEMQTISQAISAAIQAYQTGDSTAAGRFI